MLKGNPGGGVLSSLLSLRVLVLLLLCAALCLVLIRLEVAHHENRMHSTSLSVSSTAVPALSTSTSTFLRSPSTSTTSSSSLTRLSLSEIGLRTKTDKAMHHKYTDHYPLFLERLRDQPIKMLEIGFLLGYSYAMWKEYFEKGEVYVMDKDKGYPRTIDAFGFQGNQGNTADLQALLETKKLALNLDLIIDDGSHHPSHQLTSFQYLFLNGLKPGGVYIIEDVEINYWVHGEVYDLPTNFGRDHPNSMVTKAKQLVDVVNREFAPAKKPFISDFGAELDSWVNTVYFGPNFVIITKFGTLEQERALNRRYRFDPCLDKDADLTNYEFC